MYHALLTNRYLTTRVIPLIAVAAVGLCVALVIIVVSVMTGFLEMVRSSGRTMMGDVIISYPIRGIGYYDQLIADLEARPEVLAATPVVDTFGLLRMPYPDGEFKETETVQVWGIDPITFAKVTEYERILHWKPLSDAEWLERLIAVTHDLWTEYAQDRAHFRAEPMEFTARDSDWRAKLQTLSQYMTVEERAAPPLPQDTKTLRARLPDLLPSNVWAALTGLEPRLMDLEQLYADSLRLRDTRSDTGENAGIVLGMHVSIANERRSDGSYRPMRSGYWWMPSWNVTLTTVPIGSKGGVLTGEVDSKSFPVINEFLSGVFLIDETRVLLPIEVVQEMTLLDQSEIVDPDNLNPGDAPGMIDPAKATMILVRGAGKMTPDELKPIVEQVYAMFHERLLRDETVPTVTVPPPPQSASRPSNVRVQTWEEQQAQFIGPVEKERQLMQTLFSIVYVVCAGLVLSIFWAIVHEKTRDIGILRSIGASRLGILWIFLRYGLVIGFGGAIVGLGIAVLVVKNINTIHSALGDPPLWIAWTLFTMAAAVALLSLYKSRRGDLLPIILGALGTVTLALCASVVLVVQRRGGIVIWDPAVYYFTEIPNAVDYRAAFTAMIGGMVFSVLGACLPAAKAADIDPVRALRYE